jgi:hypothetical protein
MAKPTSIRVAVDLEEYSRFEISEGRATINVSVTVAGGGNMSTEQIKIDLIKARRLRDSSIFTNTVTVTGTTDPYTFSTTIYLPDLVDQRTQTWFRDPRTISLIRRGLYFVQAQSVTDTTILGVSSDFPINPMTAQQLRTTLLFGLPLESHFLRSVKFPPVNITGVTIDEVSNSHPVGFGVLSLNTTSGGDPSLSWSGGPSVSITAPGKYILRANCGSNYIVVLIRVLSALPAVGPLKDELFVTKSTITDAMLRQWLDKACDWLENDRLAGVYLEPTRVVTDIMPPPGGTGGVLQDWDVIVSPITFYPSVPCRWIDIIFPFSSLLYVDKLWGQLANTQIVDVAMQWLEVAEKSGFSQLVPYNATLAFQFIGLVWVESLRGRIELPNFWHYTAVAGLRQTDPVLLDIIGKKAAIDALTVAGQAFRGGFSSQSISRDGVSESVSYTASAIYGLYSATIEQFDKFINREIKQLKGRYRGVNMMVC